MLSLLAELRSATLLLEEGSGTGMPSWCRSERQCGKQDIPHWRLMR